MTTTSQTEAADAATLPDVLRRARDRLEEATGQTIHLALQRDRLPPAWCAQSPFRDVAGFQLCALGVEPIDALLAAAQAVDVALADRAQRDADALVAAEFAVARARDRERDVRLARAGAQAALTELRAVKSLATDPGALARATSERDQLREALRALMAVVIDVADDDPYGAAKDALAAADAGAALRAGGEGGR